MNWLFLSLLIFFAHPGFCQDDEGIETDLIVEERAKKAKAQALIQDTAAAASEFSLSKQLKNSTEIFDPKFQKNLEMTFANAKLWERTPEEVRKIIEEGSRGKPAEKVFKSFPKLLTVFTDILHDKEAVPGFIRILGKKQKLKQYFAIWVVLIIGVWLFRKYFLPPEPSFMRRMFTSIVVNLCVSAASMTIFYLFFMDEIKPLLLIIARHTFY